MKSLGINITGLIDACEGYAIAKTKAKNVPKVTMNKATQPGKCLFTDISGPYKKSILGNIRNIEWANCHVQKSPIAKDFNVEGDTDIVDIPFEKQDEDVILVVLLVPAVQDFVLNKVVPLVKQTRFQLSEAMGIQMMRSVKMLRRKQN